MAFDNFFSTLSQTAINSDYRGIFATSASTISLSANLSSLSAEGSDIVKWIRYRMGEPKIVAEIDNVQIFSAFEESNIEYGATINRHQATNWLSNIYGLNRDFSTQNLTDKLPHNTLDYLMRLAAPFSSEATVGGMQNERKAYCSFASTDMTKDLLTDFTDVENDETLLAYVTSVSAANIQVRRVYHEPPSSMHRMYDPYSSANVLAQEMNYESYSTESLFYIMPIYGDLMRAGMMETNDNIRRSGFSYQVIGGKIRLLPQPTSTVRVYIDYTVEMDPYNPDFKGSTIGDPSITGISSIHNIPFSDINFENINSTGKRWIRQYTLALSMETLGRIRRKYASIPIPNGEVNLDGDALVQEGMEKQMALKDELTSDLEKVNNVELMRGDAEQAAALQDQMGFIPFPTPFAMMG
tara:strand:+ start:234 stop:1466 length:1233 start_codon:yes stop_codon:yes gene_type:complete